MDASLYRELGKISATLISMDEKLDDLKGKHGLQETRLATLERDSTRVKTTLATFKWLGGIAFSVVGFIGAEKLAAFLGIINHIV